MANTLTQDDETATRDLLMGRRIVAAEMGDFPTEGYNKATGRLTLDDGTQVLIAPNDGGCSCGGGDYDLDKLTTVDNVITDVRLACEEEPGHYGQSYRVYVVADNVEINVLSVKGDDGSGYYGTGYELFVVPAV